MKKTLHYPEGFQEQVDELLERLAQQGIKLVSPKSGQLSESALFRYLVNQETRRQKIMEAININQSVPVWGWNGYNEQWCESYSDRETVISAALTHTESVGEKLEAAEIIEDGEHMTIVVESGYEFHGWRWKVYVFTTRPGSFVEDEDDSTLGEWQPAA